ncbi:hypothetical protein TRFO_24837 [Tritrichomonas foetus]|uniref:Uncharacterized protein n=1 Tax=Tritrichomonas foetus TaxID=1144522 RepID=A0A1J4KBX1_9EUKA|nr:hypothetical protein TRFO_24837 [Tritrichomonas foetus]|eukprot:OHT06965.1 hypothetical protein TRFO_24837 [Tritrichomonas foetus]
MRLNDFFQSIQFFYSVFSSDNLDFPEMERTRGVMSKKHSGSHNFVLLMNEHRSCYIQPEKSANCTCDRNMFRKAEDINKSVKVFKHMCYKTISLKQKNNTLQEQQTPKIVVNNDSNAISNNNQNYGHENAKFGLSSQPDSHFPEIDQKFEPKQQQEHVDLNMANHNQLVQSVQHNETISFSKNCIESTSTHFPNLNPQSPPTKEHSFKPNYRFPENIDPVMKVAKELSPLHANSKKHIDTPDFPSSNQHVVPFPKDIFPSDDESSDICTQNHRHLFKDTLSNMLNDPMIGTIDNPTNDAINQSTNNASNQSRFDNFDHILLEDADDSSKVSNIFSQLRQNYQLDSTNLVNLNTSQLLNTVQFIQHVQDKKTYPFEKISPILDVIQLQVTSTVTYLQQLLSQAQQTKTILTNIQSNQMATLPSPQSGIMENSCDQLQNNSTTDISNLNNIENLLNTCSEANGQLAESVAGNISPNTSANIDNPVPNATKTTCTNRSVPKPKRTYRKRAVPQKDCSIATKSFQQLQKMLSNPNSQITGQLTPNISKRNQINENNEKPNSHKKTDQNNLAVDSKLDFETLFSRCLQNKLQNSLLFISPNQKDSGSE